jgi:hypothetical protein
MTLPAKKRRKAPARKVRGLLCALTCLLALGDSAFAVNSSIWSTVQPILQRNISVLNSPPIYTPGANVNAVACGTNDFCGLNVPDGPVLGNGGATAAIGGTAAAQTYTLTTTDFWYGFTTAVVGSVTVNTPGFDSSATYKLMQDPGLAEARATFTEGGQQLQIRSILFATSNVLLIQLNNSGSNAISGIQIVTQAGSVGTVDPLPVTSGMQGNTGYVTRSTAANGNPYPATDALAIYVVDDASTTSVTNSSTVVTTLSVPAGQVVNVVVGVGGGAGSTTYVNDAVTLADSQTDATLSALINAHEAWWQNFWTSGATIDLGGGPVERLWYSWLYMLAAADRAGHIMPGMQLIQTEDHNIWLGWWTSDYNIENTYLGVFSANHPELAAPYDASLNNYMATAMANAGGTSSYPEVMAEAQWGPGNNNQYTTDWGDHGDAAWLATNLVYQWNYTRNATWANQVAYPWMLATAHYWDKRLVYQNGYYNVVGSAQNENSSYTLNPIGDLSNLRGLYTALIDMSNSGAVTSSASDLALWETELANLAPLPTFTYNGHTDFKATQDAPGFYGGDAMPTNGAIWAPVLGLGSPAAQLQALQNTIYDLGDNANIWYQNNSIGWIYPVAARAGLPDAYSRLSAIATGRLGEPGEQQANGTVVFATNGGGGGEGAGNIEAVDEMLLSSYDGVLRFFPAWPMARNVSFSNMAAVGDFQVSSGVTGGVIQPTTVVSSAGRTLTIAQPWPGSTISITDTSTGLVVSGSGATLSTATTAGHSYAVAFSGGAAPPPDLAQLGTASASSDIGSIDWWAGYANDGQTASMPSTLGWSSSSNLSSDHTEYYQLDLGSNMTFNQVTLWPRSDAPNQGQGFPSSYNVAVSYDGMNWTVVATGTAASPPSAAVIVPFATQTARYVRINGLHLTANPNDSGNYRMQFAEVGVFNVAQSAPAFSLSLSAPSLNLPPGNGSTVTLTAVPANGFTGTVTFSQSGLPAGANFAFVSTGGANQDYFVVYVQPGTAAGTFPITLTATSGSATVSIPFTLVITSSQTISFAAISSQPAGSTLTLKATASSGLPVSYTSSTTSVCTVTGSTVSLLAAGTCSIVASQSGNATYPPAPSVSQSFTVTAGPSFTLALSAATLSLAPGSGGSVSVTAKPLNGFSGTVNFSASGVPAGVDIAFLSTGGVNQDYFIVYVPAGTAAGTFTITLKGTSAATSASATVTLVIT